MGNYAYNCIYRKEVKTMVSFGDRIRELGDRIKKEEQEIAKDLGLTKSQLSHYINGRRKVPSELLQKIVDKYNINPQFLFRENAPLYNTVKEEKQTYVIKNEYAYIPTTISAGLPINVDGITDADKISIPDAMMGKWAGHSDILFTRISGDSMNNIMADGSLIAIKSVDNVESLKDGDMVVFSHNHEYSVKHFYKAEDKLIFKPDSTNRAHHEQHFNINDGIEIHGKVVLYIVEMD